MSCQSDFNQISPVQNNHIVVLFIVLLKSWNCTKDILSTAYKAVNTDKIHAVVNGHYRHEDRGWSCILVVFLKQRLQ